MTPSVTHGAPAAAPRKKALGTTTVGYAGHSATTPLVPFTFERREPGPHDVQIEILYCGVCHSDLHQARNEWGTTEYPIVPGHEMDSLRNVILLVLAAVVAKNILVWIAGQLGATLQEYVTRDLRDAVYGHLANLPLGYFTQMKSGQMISRVINDTSETRLILTQVVTQATQSA